MNLTPREIDKLYIHVVADLARRRTRRCELNYSEAVAVISEAIVKAPATARPSRNAWSSANRWCRRRRDARGAGDGGADPGRGHLRPRHQARRRARHGGA